MLNTEENLKHDVYEIFPTVIYRGQVKCHREFKEKYLLELLEYWHFAEDLPRQELKSPENSGRYLYILLIEQIMASEYSGAGPCSFSNVSPTAREFEP